MERSPVGYALVANFQSSDRNFSHYRGFLSLHSRLLSDLQYDIECLETELANLDQWDMIASAEDPRRLTCLQCKDRDRDSDYEDMPGNFKEQFTRTRPVLMEELHTKLMRYGMVPFLT